MARQSTFQYTKTMTINREGFLKVVVRNTFLSKKDLRVISHLMTHLDSLSFKEISKKQIAEDLDITKSDVSKSIDNLIDFEVIEVGSTQSVKNGYRLLF